MTDLQIALNTYKMVESENLVLKNKVLEISKESKTNCESKFVVTPFKENKGQEILTNNLSDDYLRILKELYSLKTKFE